MSSLKRKAGGQAGSDVKKPKQDASIMSFFSGAGPKAQSGAAGAGTGGADAQPAAAASGFDKQKWASRLTEEQRQLLSLEINTLHESWLAVLKDELVSREFLDLKRFLRRESETGRRWYPPQNDVYSWSRHTPFNTVKVVILGQDPYHNTGQAHGLAFSVRDPTPAPPSLRNMYTCLKKDYPAFTSPPRNGGLLVPWAERGVLMLNTCLTVRAHEANSHANKGWERFTQKAIDMVAARRTRGVVFMAWGAPAGKRVAKVDAARHLILRSVHPSPLSAHRGFFDCRHFRQANDWLVKRHGAGAEVDWALVPGNSTLPGGGGGGLPSPSAASPSSTGLSKKESVCDLPDDVVAEMIEAVYEEEEETSHSTEGADKETETEKIKETKEESTKEVKQETKVEAKEEAKEETTETKEETTVLVSTTTEPQGAVEADAIAASDKPEAEPAGNEENVKPREVEN